MTRDDHQDPVRALPQEGDVGYIRVTTFNEQTPTGLEQAVERLKKARSATS